METLRDDRLEDERNAVRNELLDALMAERPEPFDARHEVVASMLVDETHSIDIIRGMLNRKEAEGELKSRRVNYNGQRVKAYRKAKPAD